MTSDLLDMVPAHVAACQCPEHDAGQHPRVALLAAQRRRDARTLLTKKALSLAHLKSMQSSHESKGRHGARQHVRHVDLQKFAKIVAKSDIQSYLKQVEPANYSLTVACRRREPRARHAAHAMPTASGSRIAGCAAHAFASCGSRASACRRRPAHAAHSDPGGSAAAAPTSSSAA